METKHYAAPWSRLLIVSSTLATLICLGIPFIPAVAGKMAASRLGWIVALPCSVTFGSALFTIRGYSLAPGAILIHRLCWATRLSLAGLQSAEYQPEAMRGAWRTFGNGGFFSFSGFFRSKTLGNFRAYLTDLRRVVVLRYPDRTVVLSPADPEGFIREVLQASRGQ